ncbi:MAG: hypothetical protein MI673_01965 [Thiotrichales bacterium]|nr:hypothetical protein [Thiotrichales bacterium]
MRTAWIILCCLIPATLTAGTIEDLKVEYLHGRYSVRFAATVDAHSSRVFKVITNYDQLHRLNDAFIESRLLSKSKNQKRSLVVSNMCLLFYCFEARMVEDVIERDGREIISVVDISESDYHYGRNHWTLTPLSDQQTRLEFHCEKEPAFWIPPVIGPLLVKQQMRSASLETIRRIEHLARDGG